MLLLLVLGGATTANEVGGVALHLVKLVKVEVKHLDFFGKKVRGGGV
jgi:hypothetical protein